MYHTLSGSRPPVFRLFTTLVAVSDAAFFVAFLGGILGAESTTTRGPTGSYRATLGAIHRGLAIRLAPPIDQPSP